MKPAFTLEEKALVKRALADDQQAQYAIYKKYVGAMFHIVMRMVGNREDAEDVTQEAFTKVFQRLGSFRGDSILGAWIKRVTVNTALNFMRQKKKLFFEEINEKTTAIDEVEIDEAAWVSDIRNIHEAIKKLPGGCRMVFNLYMLEGYKHAEVADDSKYSEYNIGDLSQQFSLSQSFDDDINLGRVAADFQRIHLNGKYAKMEFRIDDGAQFYVDVEMEYGKFDHPEFDIRIHKELNNKLEIKGYVGSEKKTPENKLSIKGFDNTVFWR